MPSRLVFTLACIAFHFGGLMLSGTLPIAEGAEVNCTARHNSPKPCTACATHHCCAHECGCDVPCQPVTPRKGPPPEEDVPREGPPAVFAGPPPTGTIEGPSRGMEIGGISLTFPEITIGLPRLRFHGCSYFRRDAQMRFDSAIGPQLASPAMAVGRSKPSDESRDQDESRDEPSNCNRSRPEPPSDKSPVQSRSTDCNCKSLSANEPARGTDELEQQVRDLKQQIVEQGRVLQNSMSALQELERRAGEFRSTTPVTAKPHDDLPPRPIIDAETSTHGMRPLPKNDEPIQHEGVSRAAYLAPLLPPPPSRASSMRRLPPVEKQEWSRQ